ncbi:unnamed protein product [Rodentolepis nana]|uniref:Ubiquitin_4 domain-containing protein n=1 Tax=Rodentolepis nana TaxID=102285 RepID=A0A0R3T7H6_RODNA|nr:unnamed protein product [Rodentolepis nana]
MDESLVDEVRKFNDVFRAFQEKVTKDLFSLIDGDEFVKDIGCSNPDSLEKRIDNAIAHHHGQAIRLFIQRGDERIPITVSNDGSVHDLHAAVAAAIDEKLSNEGAVYDDLISNIDLCDMAAVCHVFSLNPPPKHLNWRRFWRTHCLVSNEVHLNDKNTPLKKVPGLYNNTVIRFARRNRKKQRL